jgi:hypothetical protein
MKMAKWLYKLDIKQFLGSDTSNEAVRLAAKNIAQELRTKLPKTWLEGVNEDCELIDIIFALECISEYGDASCEDINSALASLYDWADDNRVWLGL